MSPRPRCDDDAVLRAALEVIGDHGVAGLTVDTVAARAGVGKATIYRHWGSRAALVHAAVLSMERPWAEPDTGTVRGDLVALLGHLVAYLGTPGTGRVFTSFVDAAAREPEFGALLRDIERDGRGRFERALRRGVGRGELPATADLRLAVDLLMSPFVYRRLVQRTTPRAGEVAPLVDAVLTAFAGVPAPTA